MQFFTGEKYWGRKQLGNTILQNNFPEVYGEEFAPAPCEKAKVVVFGGIK